ncbi:unnamed protein product, partial [Mesorhabditis belari]|uniref:Groucho/TLE N-terminal Q-rich domain-containing protein n=1 Tax=Mesorhabditis belari TaxID=2138241 RepID=A0AAF3F845_9BILA
MSQALLNEHIEAIRKDYMQSVNQLQQQSRELATAREELNHSKQLQMQQMQELSIELAKQQEIANRLTRLISDYMPHLPQQQQVAVMTEVMQLEKMRMTPISAMEQQQAMLAQMFMQQAQAAQAQQVHAAQLLGLGRGMMSGGAPGASPRGGKPNGVQPGMPQVSMSPGFPLAMMSQFGLPSMPQFAHPVMPIPGMQMGQLAPPPTLNVQVSTPSRTHSSGSRTPLSMQAQPSPREKPTPTAVVSSSLIGSAVPIPQEGATGSPVVSPQSADSAPHSIDGHGSAPLQIADSPQIKNEVKGEELSVA